MSSTDNPLKTSSALIGQLAAVIVLYNSAEVIEGCLEQLPVQAEVIIVDNASADDGLERARVTRPDAIAVRSERNLGFGGGCNLGWRATRKPYVAFINPDVRVNGTTLPMLLRRLVEEEHSMVGPALLDAAGSPRLCKRRPSALLDVCGLLPVAGRWGPVGWDGKLDPRDPVYTSGGRVDGIEGACFVVRRADLEAIDGFDEDFFLYYEEESLALRLARLGGGAVYEPRAKAEHAGSDSTRQIAALATEHFHRSRVVFYRKRDGDLPGALIGLMLASAAIVLMAGAAVNAALGRRRVITPADLWHALRGIIAGLRAPLRSRVEY